MHRNRLLLSLVLLTVGCFRWQDQSQAPAQYFEGRAPTAVRVTRTDGTHVDLDRAVLRADTLQGYRGDPPVVVRIPIAQVGSVKTLTFNAAGTVGLVVLTPLVAILGLFVAYAIACHAGCD